MHRSPHEETQRLVICYDSSFQSPRIVLRRLSLFALLGGRSANRLSFVSFSDGKKRRKKNSVCCCYVAKLTLFTNQQQVQHLQHRRSSSLQNRAPPLTSQFHYPPPRNRPPLQLRPPGLCLRQPSAVRGSVGDGRESYGERRGSELWRGCENQRGERRYDFGSV